MLTPREIGLKAEIRHLQRMLAMAQSTIDVQRETSDRFWQIICNLAVGMNMEDDRYNEGLDDGRSDCKTEVDEANKRADLLLDKIFALESRIRELEEAISRAWKVV